MANLSKLKSTLGQVSLPAMAVALAFYVGTSRNAEAVVITESTGGFVTFAGKGNPFEILAGDPVSASASWEGDLVPAEGPFSLNPSDDPSLRLNVTVGPLRFDEVDDEDFPLFPTITFEDGLFSDVDFIVDFVFDQTLFTFDANADGFTISFFEAEPSGGPALAISPATVPLVIGIFGSSSVPEPATLALYGLGLAGLGIARRRRKAA